MNRATQVAGGKVSGAIQAAKCVARFEPIKDRIHQLRRRGVSPRIVADLVGVPYSSLFRWLKKQGESGK